MVANLRLVDKVLTEQDREAAKRLRARWKTEQAARRFTQDDAAEKMGITQGLVSQYLNEHTPLGVVATIRFAKFLRCRPSDIRPDYEHLLAMELSPDAFELASTWQDIPDDDQIKSYVRNVIINYPGRSKRIG